MSEAPRIFYPVVDVSMQARLESVYAYVVEEVVKELMQGDLSGACGFVVLQVHLETGLKIEGGKFLVDTPYSDGLTANHYWCKDGLGRIVKDEDKSSVLSTAYTVLME